MSTLTPDQLFDLLANPTERQTWDLCPAYIRQEPIQAPPGPALSGDRYNVNGTARGVPFRGRVWVENAERPFRYTYRYETTFERLYPSFISTEEYTVEPHSEGSLVHYTMWMTRTSSAGPLILRLLTFLLEPLTVPAATRRNFRNGLRYAEAFARRTNAP